MSPERPPATPRRVAVVAVVAALLAFLALGFALVFGATSVDPWAVLTGAADAVDRAKVFDLRLPRALMASVTGAALAVAGLVFQALVRNPLASPYVLGVSSGGSLGAVLALAAGATYVGPAAFAGAACAVMLVYAAARRNGRFPASSLLLAGVILNAFFGAGVTFVNVVAAPRDQERILRWIAGGLRDLYGTDEIVRAGVPVLLAIGLVFLTSRELNVLALSDDAAERAGVAVRAVRRRLFLSASLLTAVAVTAAGPIGFVGLVVPHFARLRLGPDHRLLVPAATFGGAAFLATVDAVAQGVWRTPLPAGVLTALLGGPLFLYLLRRGDRARAGLDF
jgi:iron complex transport system permease protein